MTVLCLSVPICASAQEPSPWPRLLPAAESFRLTLRENPHSKLPLGPSCTGKARLSLTCRAFTVTLQNRSNQTVRFASDCKEPRLIIWLKMPSASGGWWPVSQRIGRRAPEWTNVRLQPGESTVMETRIISPTRYGEPFSPGSHVLRAGLSMFGCMESPAGTDCLSPLEAVPTPPSTAYAIDFQEPVSVVSNEITVEAPKLHLSKVRFGFEVELLSETPSDFRTETGCMPEDTSIECRVFRYRIYNLSRQAVRYSRMSCSDSIVVPEYWDAAGGWTRLAGRAWFCTANILIQTPILPGKISEGAFTLRNLAGRFDMSPLHAPGEHRIRFKFFPSVCAASPDGRFCLTDTEEQPPLTSSEVSLHVQ